MKLVTVNVNSINLGQPLPYSLRNADGILLAAKGYVFTEREAVHALVSHSALFVDEEDSLAYQRQLKSRFAAAAASNNSNTTLSQLAEAPLESVLPEEPLDAGTLDWLDLQSRADILLRDPSSLRFLHRLDRLHRDLRRMVTNAPDTTLFALIHLAASETRYYSATHAMLVNVMCTLAAQDVLHWDSELEMTLGRASLTMNIGMTDLQNHLAQQHTAVTTQQREAIDSHADRSAEILARRGVTDALWLESIRSHHCAPSGPLAGRTPAEQVARLIMRADGFAARLSPRATRPPLAPSVAMQATYFDEGKKVDEAGASLIKVVGIYPPGSFVKLANNEIATVVRRGPNALTPKVAVLVNKQGLPTIEPAIRDTRVPEFRIVSNVPRKELKVRADLVRLLTLT